MLDHGKTLQVWKGSLLHSYLDITRLQYSVNPAIQSPVFCFSAAFHDFYDTQSQAAKMVFTGNTVQCKMSPILNCLVTSLLGFDVSFAFSNGIINSCSHVSSTLQPHFSLIEN
jgi:hypothetical protein